ncbi:MAG: serine/threonine protein phosphatase [Puniceicoccaceae bacterium]
MQEVKDSKQATVKIGYDGRVHKTFRGPSAKERFHNELRVLQYLEEQGCPFVPQVLHSEPESLYLVTTNCGNIVDKISEERLTRLFDELETYGVRHEDRFARNVTYQPRLGRFCLIDFEFATILESGEGLRLEDIQPVSGRHKETEASAREGSADPRLDNISISHRDAAQHGSSDA